MDGGLENILDVIFIPPKRRVKATASQAPRAQKVMNFKSPWIFLFLFKDISLGDFFTSWFLLSASRFSKYYIKGFFFSHISLNPGSFCHSIFCGLPCFKKKKKGGILKELPHPSLWYNETLPNVNSRRGFIYLYPQHLEEYLAHYRLPINFTCYWIHVIIIMIIKWSSLITNAKRYRGSLFALEPEQTTSCVSLAVKEY